MKTILLLFVTTITFFSEAQILETKPKFDPTKSQGSATKSAEFTVQCMGDINTPTADLKWRPTLVYKPLKKDHFGPDDALIKSIKAQKMIDKSIIENNKIAS